MLNLMCGVYYFACLSVPAVYLRACVVKRDGACCM